MEQNTNFKDLSNFNDNELKTLFLDIEKEISKRKHAKKQKLIDNFKEAYYALENANIEVYVCDTYASSFDDFEFC